jgi:ATP-dependent phosphoenolpyruvate carboxykinase
VTPYGTRTYTIIAIDFTKKIILIGNSSYTGEMKNRGIYGVGRRMPIKVTRALVAGALDGSLKNVSFRTDPYFGFSVPPRCRAHILYPMKTWKERSTRPRASSCACCRRTSSNSSSTSTPTCARPRRRCASRRNRFPV